MLITQTYESMHTHMHLHTNKTKAILKAIRKLLHTKHDM